MKWGVSRPSKFGAVKYVYNGVRYDSKKEGNFARQLDLLRSATNPTERVVKVERQVSFLLNPQPYPINYRLDFKVTYADGHTEYFEVKGFETESWKMKHKMMKEKYPHINIQVI